MSSASAFRSSTAVPRDDPRSLSTSKSPFSIHDLNSSSSSSAAAATLCPPLNHDDIYHNGPAPPTTTYHGSQIASPAFSQFHSTTTTTTTTPSPPPRYIISGDSSRPERPSSLDPGAYQHPPRASLRIATDLAPPSIPPPHRSHRPSSTENDPLAPLHPPSRSSRPAVPLSHRLSTTSIRQLVRTPSIQAALTGSIGCIGSAKSTTSSGYSSPKVVVANSGLTPLPSPLMPGDSPGPWTRLAIDSGLPAHRREKVRVSTEESKETTGAPVSHHQPLAPPSATQRNHHKSPTTESNEIAGQAPPTAARPHPQPHPHPQQWHSRNRSISDYTSESVTAAAKHHGAMGPQMKTASGGDVHIRREEILAEPLGLTASVAQPPTPPPSESSNDLGEGLAAPKHEYFEAHDRFDKKLRRWRSIRTVGQGTFSRVVLATSQMNVPDDIADASASSPAADTRLDRKALVAVKICEHGPLGGASEERVEMSLKRELEIMQTIHHPSLVNLKAFRVEPTRAILVLSYCPGGDLFEVATTHRRVLTPPLMKRIFAELVGAVSYLHEQMIVHRDIKLENVLVNLTPQELADPSTDWATYPYAVIALADLGLSRRIAPDEKLETRCGSEDYAAPEVIMGQPYDGLATDAWSLGVLLYAMLESRLPFDPHPRMNDSHRMRSRTSHRIARVDWRWLEFDGDDGDHDGSEAKFREHGLLGAMHITEGLLKRARSRWTLAKVSTEPWVREGMTIPGGLRHREEIGGAEVV